jgi:hypothetical protein
LKVNNELPANNGWCGRISTALHPEFSEAVVNFMPSGTIPHDPLYGNSSKDYFYFRVDRSRYVLMAVMSKPQENRAGTYVYNFDRCHDWPGDNVYNYQIRNF